MRALFTLALALFVGSFVAGCQGGEVYSPDESSPSRCEGDVRYFVVRELTFEVEEEPGISAGMNLDGITSDDTDPRGCRKNDYTSPHGQEGIDNQLGFLVPLVEQTLGNVITGTVQSSINEGSLLVVIGLTGLDGGPQDDCVGLSVERGGGTPLIGTDGYIEPWQTFELQGEGGRNYAPDVQMSEDILLSGPFQFQLDLTIQGNDFHFEMKNSWARLDMNADGDVISGEIAGGIDVPALSNTLMNVEAGDFATLVVPLLRSEADLAPNEDGRCQQNLHGLPLHRGPGVRLSMTPPPDGSAPAGEVVRPVPDSVLEHILARILDGTYGSGARLPAERQWTDQLGASRVSVRGALSRLAEWGVIDIRRGSGAVVRPRAEWRLDVLPAYLRHGATADGIFAVGQAMMDLLEVRRLLLVHMVGKVAERIGPGTLDAARVALKRAADARDDPARFAELDVDMIRTVLDSCGMTAPLWVLNVFSDAYLRATREVPPSVVAPPNYLEAYTEVFDLLEAGKTDEARKKLGDYLEALDVIIMSAAAAMAASL